jgi:signal transduction histidine kinase
VAIAGVVYVLQGQLPDLQSVSVAGDASRPQIEGDVGIYLPQATMAAMFGAAAVGFARSAARTGDELTRWLAGGSVMNAFARLHFVLFPSIYTDFVYSGDFLRLGFYLMLLVGAGREIRSYWRGLTHVAVTEERRRLARDLHDGLAQELVFISAQTHRLLSRDPEPHDLKRLASAADRAVAESRRAIVALSHGQETLTDALRELVDETSRRFGVPVFAELASVDVSSQVKEGVLRIAREALVNAVKHGDTEVVSVFLEGGRLTKLRVSDDGRGFDRGGLGSDGFGLTVMEEKARALGGELEVRSVPGGGTIVGLRLPG